MYGLRIYFRQHQLQDANNNYQNVVVECGDIATYIPGDTDQTWTEMTAFTDGLDKLQSSWDYINQASAKSASDATNPGGSNYDKGVTLPLTFNGDAYTYIWNWLLTNQCQTLNAIDVRIDDIICGQSFRLFEIKRDNLTYSPNIPNDGVNDLAPDCRIEVQLREQDLIWKCFQNTFVWDDWQNWFNSTGTSTKQHPTFLTCVEPRPRLMNSVRMALLLFYHSNPAINAIDFISAEDIKVDTRKVLEIDKFVPAPLIRDYIDNVAGKCGLAVDTLFHRVGTPEYSACLFHPISGQQYENASDSEASPSNSNGNPCAFLFENRWDVTLAELLDKLKLLYCAEWYVTPNATIVFKPIAELIDLAPIYDFSTGDIPIRDLTYTFDGTKKSAYGRYQYQQDAADMGSQEIANLYNDLTDFDGPTNNPMLEGELDKSFEFASTAFVRDGRTKDYIKLLIDDGEIGAFILIGMLAVLIVALVAGTLSAGAAIALGAIMAVWAVTIAAKASTIRNHFTDPAGSYSGAVRMVMSNTSLTPRVLVWDGADMTKAKVVRTVNPTANTYYNPTSVPYTTDNPIGTDNPAHSIYNYPMYFDSWYTYNMFDRFHDTIDNPLKSLETNQSFTLDTDLCLEAMNLLGLWENDFVKIGYLLVLENRPNYQVYGRIQNISIDYGTFKITIKGVVIRKRTNTTPAVPPPPPPVCVPVSIDAITLPDAQVGTAYNISIAPNGTSPITANNITAPAWLSVSVTAGSYINLAGTPASGDIGSAIVISFTATNACGSVDFSTTINVTATAVTPPVPGFTFDYGFTELDTTGTAPDEATYVASVDGVTTTTGTIPNTGNDIQVNIFGNTSDKVLFIEVPATEQPLLYWSEEGSPQLQQAIDQTFAGGNNVWFKSVHGSNTIYMTRFQTSFPMGAIILSR